MKFFRRNPGSSSHAPAAVGHSVAGRQLLQEAAASAEVVSANRERTPSQVRAVLTDLTNAVTVLRQANDPLEAQACWILASRLRYEKGRGEETLSLFERAVTLDPSSTAAWTEFLDYVTYNPDPPLLVADYHRMRQPARNACLPLFMSVSRGYDHWGRLPEADRQPFLDAMSTAIRTVADPLDVAFWFGELGLREEKSGSFEQAVDWMSRAAATGRARPQVVDRLSTHLVKVGTSEALSEAVIAIDAALSASMESQSLSDRLAKRRARCQKLLATAESEGALAVPDTPAPA